MNGHVAEAVWERLTAMEVVCADSLVTCDISDRWIWLQM
jgi:hypothetical protein